MKQRDRKGSNGGNNCDTEVCILAHLTLIKKRACKNAASLFEQHTANAEATIRNPG